MPCSPATEINSAAVGHRGDFSEPAGVDGQSPAMMRGVLDHGPHDVADGLAAHDRAGREWPREILRLRERRNWIALTYAVSSILRAAASEVTASSALACFSKSRSKPSRREAPSMNRSEERRVGKEW